MTRRRTCLPHNVCLSVSATCKVAYSAVGQLGSEAHPAPHQHPTRPIPHPRCPFQGMNCLSYHNPCIFHLLTYTHKRPACSSLPPPNSPSLVLLPPFPPPPPPLLHAGISFANFCFFALHAVVLLGMTRESDLRMYFHASFWGLKMLLWVGALIGFFFVPSKAIYGYAQVW